VRNVLVATDADWVFDEVDAALGDVDTKVERVRAGRDVLPAVLRLLPELLVLDMQIGNMGGLAACINLRHEEGAGRITKVPTLVLLDREADVFLARRSGADGWLVKPLDAFRLRKAAGALLSGGTYEERSPIRA
jgi:DNA-binding response OmpR family regulator